MKKLMTKVVTLNILFGCLFIPALSHAEISKGAKATVNVWPVEIVDCDSELENLDQMLRDSNINSCTKNNDEIHTAITNLKFALCRDTCKDLDGANRLTCENHCLNQKLMDIR